VRIRKNRNRNTNPVVGHKQLFTGSLSRKNRHRRSLRESIRIDVNLVGLLARASLNRSNLPSAFMHQWRARLDPLRSQWLGRSGFTPDSHTTPSHKFYTGSKGASQIVFTQTRTAEISIDPSHLAFRNLMWLYDRIAIEAG
jgi:hypothetical protein